MRLHMLLSTGSDAIEVKSNSTTDFLLGSNISLSISYNNIQGATVSWSKDGVVLAYWSKASGQTGNYTGRLTIIGDGSLVISNSTKADTGNYTVTVGAIGETIGMLTFPVKIYDPVTNASVSQSPAAVSEGTPVVNLTCNASSGGVTYTWTRDGQSLPSNSSWVTLDGGQTLQIIFPNRTHGGNYTCNVSNPMDWETASRMLNISYSDPNSLSGGAIAGIVIGSVFGAILLIALIILVIFCVCNRRKGVKGKNPAAPHKEAIRTISGATLSPDDPAYFTMNNIMYRSSSISMGSYVMNNGDNTSDYVQNPSPNPPPSQVKVKKATQV